MSEILVVSNDSDGVADMLPVLHAAGYRVSAASTFDEARRLLANRSPDLVIADERLGAFNGLHVIVRARADHPHVRAIVTTRLKSRGLEADARSLNVECMVKPHSPAEWLAPISRTLGVDSVGGSSTIHSEMIHAID